MVCTCLIRMWVFVYIYVYVPLSIKVVFYLIGAHSIVTTPHLLSFLLMFTASLYLCVILHFAYEYTYFPSLELTLTSPLYLSLLFLYTHLRLQLFFSLTRTSAIYSYNRILTSWVPNPFTNAQISTKYNYVLLLALTFLFSWRGFEFTSISAHFFFDEVFFSVSWVFILIHVGAYCLALPTTTLFYKSRLILFKLTVGYILFATFPLLIAATNLYTVFILIEFVSLTVFFFLCLNVLTENLNYSLSFFLKWVHLTLVFFWVNACISLLLFITLFVYFLNFNSWDFQSYPLNLVMSLTGVCHHSINVNFNLLLLLLILIIKCGLTPTFFWKITVFKDNTAVFLTFYVLAYYTPLFIYMSLMVDFFLFNLTQSVFSSFCTAYTLLFIVAIVFVLTTSMSLNTFIVVSSVIVSSTLLIALLSSQPTTNSVFSISNVLIYYYMYFLTNLTLFIVILNSLSKVPGFTTTQPINLALMLVSTSASVRYTLIIIFFSLATLPPLTTFFPKLLLITFLLLNVTVFKLITVTFFFFVVLVFYYNNVKFVFTGQELLNSTAFVNTKLLSHSTPKGYLVSTKTGSTVLLLSTLLLLPILFLPELVLFFMSLI